MILVFVGQKLWGKYEQNKPNDYLKAINGFDKDNISKIDITDINTGLKIEKNGEEWSINGKNADKNIVDDLINGFFIKTSPYLVATSEEQIKNLGLTDDLKKKVIFYSGDKSVEFEIGKNVSSFTAVMVKGQAKVYKLDQVPTISTDINNWVDLAIIDLDSTVIKSIAFEDGENFKIVKNENEMWSFENLGKEINNEAVNSFLMKLNPLMANRLASEEDLVNYPKVRNFGLIVNDKNNKEVKISFYKGLEDYLARIEGGDSFIISATKAEELNKTSNSLSK